MNDNESKENEDEMALLSKKLQKILREKRNKEKRRSMPQRKSHRKNEQGGSSNNVSYTNT